MWRCGGGGGGGLAVLTAVRRLLLLLLSIAYPGKKVCACVCGLCVFVHVCLCACVRVCACVTRLMVLFVPDACRWESRCLRWFACSLTCVPSPAFPYPTSLPIPSVVVAGTPPPWPPSAVGDCWWQATWPSASPTAPLPWRLPGCVWASAPGPHSRCAVVHSAHHVFGPCGLKCYGFGKGKFA